MRLTNYLPVGHAEGYLFVNVQAGLPGGVMNDHHSPQSIGILPFLTTCQSIPFKCLLIGLAFVLHRLTEEQKMGSEEKHSHDDYDTNAFPQDKPGKCR